MFIFILGIILGFLFTSLYRKRMGIYNRGLGRIGIYFLGSCLSVLYSSIIVAAFSIIAPKQYYAGEPQRLISIKTVQQNFSTESTFYYRCMIMRSDKAIYAANIPADQSVIFEDVNSTNAQVLPIYVTVPGLWKMITWPEDKLYQYSIHVPPSTVTRGGDIR